MHSFGLHFDVHSSEVSLLFPHNSRKPSQTIVIKTPLYKLFHLCVYWNYIIYKSICILSHIYYIYLTYIYFYSHIISNASYPLSFLHGRTKIIIAAASYFAHPCWFHKARFFFNLWELFYQWTWKRNLNELKRILYGRKFHC